MTTMQAILAHPYLLVAIGGALGSLARYQMNQMIEVRFGSDFPFGTLAINIIGSLLIGLVAGLATGPKNEWIRQLVMIGVLGGYTTFSSFSLQSVNLLQNGRLGAAGLYIMGSVVLCLLGSFAGLLLAWAIAGHRSA